MDKDVRAHTQHTHNTHTHTHTHVHMHSQTTTPPCFYAASCRARFHKRPRFSVVSFSHTHSPTHTHCSKIGGTQNERAAAFKGDTTRIKNSLM